MYTRKKQAGFTLIELLLVMGLIAMLATVALVAINPARQFAQARDTQRMAHLHTILTAVQARIANNKGIFETGCGGASALPEQFTLLSGGNNGYNIFPCLVPDFLSSLPFDPKNGNFSSDGSYDTKYEIMQEAGTGRIILRAPHSELSGEMRVSS